jgi:hypothetical protein
LIITPKAAKKIRNLRSKPNVYFSVDDENFPYKGVKGKATAIIIEDPKRTVPLGKKINMKYLGTLDHPIPMMILDSAKKGNHVVVEISPRFFPHGILLRCNKTQSNSVSRSLLSSCIQRIF